MGCDCPDDANRELKTDPAVRMHTCKHCPKYKQNLLVGPTCGTLAIPEYDTAGKMTACGCILRIKTKIKSRHCPQGKW
jgi:hypothetical protein